MNFENAQISSKKFETNSQAKVIENTLKRMFGVLRKFNGLRNQFWNLSSYSQIYADSTEPNTENRDNDQLNTCTVGHVLMLCCELQCSSRNAQKNIQELMLGMYEYIITLRILIGYVFPFSFSYSLSR